MNIDKQRELKLWQEYKQGNQKALQPLVVSLNPLIQNQVQKYNNTPLPRTALEAEARRLAIRAFQDYDPNKAGLSTHVTNHLKHLQRFVIDYQNVGRIPENRAIAISRFINVKANMEEDLGRPPSAAELADELHWSPAEIDRMERELRNDLSVTTGAEDSFFDYDYNKTDKVKEIVDFVYWDPKTTNEERKYLEYKFGLRGGQKLEVKDIALKLNRSETYVRKMGMRLGSIINEAYQL